MKKHLQAIIFSASLLVLGACRTNTPISPQMTRMPQRASALFSQNQQRPQSQRIYSIENLRRDIAKAVFVRLDVSRNTYLETSEYQAHYPQLKSTISDGSVDRNSFMEQKDLVLGEHLSAERFQKEFRTFFNRDDRNKDGFISLDEVQSQSMMKFDYDGDQKINPGEFEDYTANIYGGLEYQIDMLVRMALARGN